MLCAMLLAAPPACAANSAALRASRARRTLGVRSPGRAAAATAHASGAPEPRHAAALRGARLLASALLRPEAAAQDSAVHHGGGDVGAERALGRKDRLPAPAAYRTVFISDTHLVRAPAHGASGARCARDA
jgi:hypothetical protein